MADLSPAPSDDTGMSPDRGPVPSTPRWVKVAGIVALVVVLVVALMLVSGHGPGRHMHSAGHGDGTPPASLIQRGVRSS